MWLYWVCGLAGRMFGIVRFVEQTLVVVLVSLKVFYVSIQLTLENPACDVTYFFESDQSLVWRGALRIVGLYHVQRPQWRSYPDCSR